jgi:hypothetical protein
VRTLGGALQVFVPLATFLAAVGGLSAFFMGLYTRRENRRNLAALGKKAEAEASQVVVSTAMGLLDPLQKKVNELTEQLDAALERAHLAEAESDALRRGNHARADELAAQRTRLQRG